jgi:hypothetical protein
MATARHKAHWAVKVITPGTYEISVLRWPEEAGQPISAALPAGENVPGATRAYRANPGLALPSKEAILRIDGKEIARKHVGEADKQIAFITELTVGSHQLVPAFLTDAGGEIGYYYAIVRKR